MNCVFSCRGKCFVNLIADNDKQLFSSRWNMPKLADISLLIYFVKTGLLWHYVHTTDVNILIVSASFASYAIEITLRSVSDAKDNALL